MKIRLHLIGLPSLNKEFTYLLTCLLVYVRFTSVFLRPFHVRALYVRKTYELRPYYIRIFLRPYYGRRIFCCVFTIQM